MENYLKDEQKTKSYKDKMKIDKENILIKFKRETKYIQNKEGQSMKLFLHILEKLASFRMIKKNRDNANKAQYLPIEVKK